ncbi:pyruvate dehydrogenase complex dihydrolipoamide acetyltransferase [Sneathiella chungangensis]|uniref:Acetyltransferase component of pyruvate dehydrogenase complex n=1 Tax=Sneathiella chungangensis TaxID=1418234 RepID=A0A845MAH1_9PROT|nr:pyruvate dehydrogenase complex dihydrolipoamide acetyltransferase [Sneathiella chungangensis]MZR20952.1 pyruvate dehydrogenase complex dihydrolipoamide acetyltransferase [Sneathiella chungangensis]
MPITITMPALSPTMTEGKLATWQAKEGDSVSSGDVLAEIETDKATMEVEAVDEGTLGKILIPAGTDNVAVNTPIAILLEEGEDASALDGYKAGGGAAPADAPEPATEEKAEAAPASAPAAPAAPTSSPASEPAKNTAPGPAKSEDRIFASPLARRIAKDAGLDLGAIAGTGPHGRIIKADVEKSIASGGAKAPATQPAAAAAAPTPAAQAVTPPPAGNYEEIPLTSMRKTIARRLSEAKQTIPHFYLTIECELDNLLAMRKELNARSDDYKISVNDFIIRASALALRKVPTANACWGGDKILQYKDVDISVAVAIEGGLITPVVRNADQKGLAAISNEMKELANKAKAGKLMPEEYQGGCFSISNLGMFGIKEFSAVINPPQAAILAIGAGEMRPVVKEGALAMANMMSVTLSCDHRVIDGALGAELLKHFKGYIQEPLTMML